MSGTDRKQLGAALGRMPSGMFIVTAANDEGRTGILASWVQQAAFEPPMITVAVKKGRSIEPLLIDDAPFAVNIIGEQGKRLISRFVKGVEPDQDLFEGLETSQGETGAPVVDEALAFIECRVRGSIEAGDHNVYTAEVVGGKLLSDGPPRIHVRESGLHY